MVNKVEYFLEKPDKETAEIFIKDKKYSWNSGMFVFKASSVINDIKIFTPQIIKNFEHCLKMSEKDLDFLRLEKESFLKCENVLIDVSVFEKTKKAFEMPLDCGWDDVGSWESLWKIMKKDNEGNSLKGKILTKATKNSLIRCEHKFVVSIGLENIIILETNDAVLVANKDYSESIKNLVSLMYKKGIDEGQNYKKVYSPWGSSLSIGEGDNWKIKKIEVNPGASLSLQMHYYHRSEHWVVVKGKAKVQIDSIKKMIGKNESVYIPLGVKHRLSKPTKSSLILIEIQSESYLGEDDIKRFDDIYGR